MVGIGLHYYHRANSSFNPFRVRSNVHAEPVGQCLSQRRCVSGWAVFGRIVLGGIAKQQIAPLSPKKIELLTLGPQGITHFTSSRVKLNEVPSLPVIKIYHHKFHFTLIKKWAGTAFLNSYHITTSLPLGRVGAGNLKIEIDI